MLFSWSICISLTFAQDFQISEKGNASFAPDISADSVGNVIIVWTDYRNSRGIYGGTGNDGDIYGQFVSAEGKIVGNNFRITDDFTLNNISFAGQKYPRCAMNKNGKFVVTWIDTRPDGTPDDPTLPLDFNIYAQIFDSNHNPIGKNFLVNEKLLGAQLNPDIIILENGNFFIIWCDSYDSNRIYIQAFNSEGKKINSNLRTDLYSPRPNIELFNNKGFIIISDKYAQIFDYNLSTLTKFEILPAHEISIKLVDSLLLFTFVKDRILPEKFIDFDVYITAYNLSGELIFPPVLVNDSSKSWQIIPSLAIEDSMVMVVWEDDRNNDCKDKDIYGQRFDLRLKKLGKNYKITHENNVSVQRDPNLVIRNGYILSIWTDSRQNNFYPTDPPLSKMDVWGTFQSFINPLEGEIIKCTTSDTTIIPKELSIRIFPNPSTGNNFISYSLPEKGKVEIIVFDILGRQIKKMSFHQQNKGKHIEKISLDDCTSGVYIIRFVTMLETKTIYSEAKKFIIHK